MQQADWLGYFSVHKIPWDKSAARDNAPAYDCDMAQMTPSTVCVDVQRSTDYYDGNVATHPLWSHWGESVSPYGLFIDSGLSWTVFLTLFVSNSGLLVLQACCNGLCHRTCFQCAHGIPKRCMNPRNLPLASNFNVNLSFVNFAWRIHIVITDQSRVGCSTRTAKPHHDWLSCAARRMPTAQNTACATYVDSRS